MKSALFTLCGLVGTGLLSLSLSAPAGQDHDHDHDHALCDHPADMAAARCVNLTEGWLEPWHHTHFRGGTPLIHNFGFEPAFLGREFFADYSYAALDEGSEHEIEFELEWALTKRIGVVLEQGYVFDDPDAGRSADGWGDFAVVPRFVLVDCERCILSANLEIAAPTGSDQVGAGEEWHLAPFVNTWCDLGNWWSLTSQCGVEFALDSNESELFFAVGLAKAIRVFEAQSQPDAQEHIHELPVGILSVIGEVSGSAVLDGDPGEEGVFSLEGLIGINFGISRAFDVRAGYLFPLNAHSELDGGATVGVIRRF